MLFTEGVQEVVLLPRIFQRAYLRTEKIRCRRVEHPVRVDEFRPESGHDAGQTVGRISLSVYSICFYVAEGDCRVFGLISCVGMFPRMRNIILPLKKHVQSNECSVTQLKLCTRGEGRLSKAVHSCFS